MFNAPGFFAKSLLTSLLASFLASLLIALALTPARAEYPDKPITLIVPFAPGIITDISSRTIAKVLSEQLKQPIIVENKVGAGGIVGMQAAALAKPDGYTLVTGANGILATFPSLYKTLSYDPKKDFIPIHGLALSPLVMTVAADKPYKTLAQFIAFAKSAGRPIKYGSGGIGTNAHFAGVMMSNETGVRMTHVPYKSGAQGMIDMQSGEIDFYFDFAVTTKPLLEGKKVTALMVTSPTRLSSLPDVPTAAEAGVPKFNITSWSAIMTPAGTPPEVVDKLTKAMVATMKDPEVVKFYGANGSVIMDGYAGDKLGQFIADETIKFRDLIKQVGIEPQ